MKNYYFVVVLLLSISRSYASNSSAQRIQLTEPSLEAQVQTVYGTKPVLPGTNASVESTSEAAKPRAIDLLIGLALLFIPIIIVCGIHCLVTCRHPTRKQCKPKNQGKIALTPLVVPVPPDRCEYTSPPPTTRPKSKSVTWQSPFETRARPSHRMTSALDPMAGSELHFVMVATPEKVTPSRQWYRRSRTRRQKKPWEVNDDPIPQYRLDRLDSSPREEELPPPPPRSSTSSLSLGASPVQPPLEPVGSPVAILQDSGDYDSDSPRMSLSSVNSDDPEILRKLDDAMKWTQAPINPHESLDPPSRAMRSSSSLGDFRHDLHHENSQDDPEQITRSSEYSF